MPLTDRESLDACLHLDDEGQNQAIYCIMKALEADRLATQETNQELKRVGSAIEALTVTDIQQGMRWNFLDKIGISVLALIFSVLGGAVVSILNCLINPK